MVIHMKPLQIVSFFHQLQNEGGVCPKNTYYYFQKPIFKSRPQKWVFFRNQKQFTNRQYLYFFFPKTSQVSVCIGPQRLKNQIRGSMKRRRMNTDGLKVRPFSLPLLLLSLSLPSMIGQKKNNFEVFRIGLKVNRPSMLFEMGLHNKFKWANQSWGISFR